MPGDIVLPTYFKSFRLHIEPCINYPKAKQMENIKLVVLLLLNRLQLK